MLPGLKQELRAVDRGRLPDASSTSTRPASSSRPPRRSSSETWPARSPSSSPRAEAAAAEDRRGAGPGARAARRSSTRGVVEGGGYLNFFLDRAETLSPRCSRPGRTPTPSGRKIIVEHTNINPNKAAHIGHLRNAVLGDIARPELPRGSGRRVEVQNYLDDTGVQVADVVVGLDASRRAVGALAGGALAAEIRRDPRRLSRRRSRRRAAAARGPRVGPLRPRRPELRRRSGARREAARRPSTPSRRRRSATPLADAERAPRPSPRASPRPSSAATSRRWSGSASPTTSSRARATSSAATSGRRAFELLKGVRRDPARDRGKNAGCWVMRLEGAAEFEGMEDADKVLVRSNGTVTYTGKDVAYQLWKLGLLAADFEYEPVAVPRHGSDSPSSTRPTASRRSTGPATTPKGPTRRRRGRFGHGRDGHQRHRRPAVLSPEGRQGGGPARRLRRRGRPLGPLRVRDGRADPGLRRGAGPGALRRGPRPRLRRDVGAQGARRQGRRPPRPARREGARRRSLSRTRRTPRSSRRARRSPSARSAST